ncbi:MAG: hypothetical protein VZS44_00340 [Bacilli bacterium]|nr:hypothetical protein [Bacilli bacterium]
MFLILRKTVKKINTQTKLYFVDKSQEYDYLISEKVEKLKELDEELKEKEINKGNKVEGSNNNNFEFDFNIIDLFNNTEYQDKNIFELNKKIDEKFNIDTDMLLKKFLSFIDDDSKYLFCENLKNKFTSDVIYSLKILTAEDLDVEMKKMLSDDEYKLYKLYTEVNTSVSIDGFIDYINELIDLNNPCIVVYVGDKSKNYDHMSKYIKTIYSSDIYKGIKIKYHNKIYDYSLNERNV